MNTIRAKIVSTLLMIMALLAIPLSFQLFEEVDAGEVVCIQSLTTGEFSWYTTPGPKWQGFGKVTKYFIRDQLWFIDPQHNETLPKDALGSPAIEIRFNDGGHARINGSMAYEMPMDIKSLTKIHTLYGSQEAVEQQVIKAVAEKCIYMTGPLMSSSESYAARRNELLGDIEDQIQRGVYRTEAKDARIRDEATGEDKTVKQVHIVTLPDGTRAREQSSLIETLGIKVYNLSVRRVVYDSVVEGQIQKQQISAAASQQSIVDAKTAEQKKLTAKAEAEADQAKLVGAAEAKKGEAIAVAQMQVAVAALEALKMKTNATILAQQKFEVAEFATKEASEFKKAEQLKGEGEAARRAAVLKADGALEKKLEAWVKVNEAYATALSSYKGAIVPSVMFGQQAGGSATGVDGFQQMMQIIGAKAAKDLALDVTPGQVIIPVVK